MISSQPIWFGAKIDGPGNFADEFLTAPFATIVAEITSRLEDSTGESIQYRCAENFAAENAPNLPNQGTSSAMLGSLKATCTFSGGVPDRLSSNAKNYANAVFYITNDDSGTLPQTYDKDGELNSGFESFTINFSARLYFKQVMVAYKEAPRGSGYVGMASLGIPSRSFGVIRNLNFSYMINNVENEIYDPEVRKSLTESFASRGITVDWKSALMQMHVTGFVSGDLRGTWTNTPDRSTSTLLGFRLCSTPCKITVEHLLSYKARKAKTDALPQEGELSRSIQRRDQYEGTMTTTILNPNEGTIQLKWNPDVRVYRTYADIWDNISKSEVLFSEPLISYSQRSSEQRRYRGRRVSSANLYPAQNDKSFVQSHINRQFESNSEYSEIWDGQETGSGSGKVKIYENKIEKQVHQQPIRVRGIGSQSYEGYSFFQGDELSSHSWNISGHFKPESNYLVVDSSSDGGGSWKGIETPHFEGNLLFQGNGDFFVGPGDFGYPDYYFSPHTENSRETVAFASPPVKLLPKNVVFILGLSDSDQNIPEFKLSIEAINRRLNWLVERGVNVTSKVAQTAESFKEALKAMPDSSVLIVLVHGRPTGIRPGDGETMVSKEELEEFFETKRVIASFPLSCYASRLPFPNAVMSSIGVALSDTGGNEIGDLIGFGTNPLHMSAYRLFQDIDAAIIPKAEG